MGSAELVERIRKAVDAPFDGGGLDRASAVAIAASLERGRDLLEPLLEAGHPGLRLASPRTVNHELLTRSLDELSTLAAHGRRDEALGLLRRLVPEYGPAGPRAEDTATAAS